MAGICGVLFLYGMIAYAGLRTAKAAVGRYAKLLAAGVTSLILCQASLNVFAVLGLAPLTGVPLPFISYGLEQPDRAAGRDGPAAQRRRRAAPAQSAPSVAGRRTGRKPQMPTRIVIAAGGTAGHVVPALAVADALRAEGAEVVFVGGERAEAELVPAAGYELRRIRAEGLSRSNPLQAGARARWRAAGGGARAAAAARARARRRARRRRLRRRARSASRRCCGAIPLVLTEADSHLGLANRMLAPFARRVCLAFPIEGREGERYLVTGRPVPPPATDRAAARARFGIGPDETCVLVFGGSLGARSINEAAIEAFGDAPFHVLHVAGTRDFDALRGRRAARATTCAATSTRRRSAAALAAVGPRRRARRRARSSRSRPTAGRPS